MALPPKFAAQRIELVPRASASSPPKPAHTVELYVDYCCPFSAKLYKTLTTTVANLVASDASHAELFPSFILRQQVQPWHPSSTLMHEAALAVLRLNPAKFADFTALLFEHQKEYFDVNVVNETRNATYRRLAKLAGQAGVDEAKVYELLEISDKPTADGSLNTGNGVTNDLKLVTKMNRLIGVHVTPTVVLDGVVHDVGSSWGESEWKEWLGKNIV